MSGNFSQHTPSYWKFCNDISLAYSEALEFISWHDVTPVGWISLIKLAKYSALDIILLIFFSFIWTGIRVLCTKTVFKAIVDQTGLHGQNAKSFPESLWKLLVYSITWTLSAYLVLFKYNLFEEPVRTVASWKIEESVSIDIYMVYLIQGSFYIHSVYATLYLDKWRKDSINLIIHHFVTVFLIVGSYLFRYTFVGLLVLFLHDFSDVCLEATKLAVYMKSKEGKWQQTFDLISTFGFIGFAISWFVFRLYWFPLKAIYASAYMSRKIFSDILPPFWFPLNTLLLFLVVLHAYWFSFIIEMMYRVMTGKAKKGIDDVRDYSEQNEKVSQNHQHLNGTKKKN